jgi:hypothetical protein
MFRTAAALLAIAIALPAVLAAQTFPAATQRTFAELTARVPRTEGDGSQTVHLRWFAATGVLSAAAAKTGQSSEDARVLSVRRGGGALQPQRDPQLSPDRLVIVSVDALGREVDWRMVADPRLIRGEAADAQGRLSTRLLQRTEANVLVDIPDLPDIVALRVYEPIWDGAAFSLRLVTLAELK